jgi:type I restriction enzyme R subunit
LEQETDPNVVYKLKNTLDEFRIYSKQEVDLFAKIFFQSDVQDQSDLGKLSSIFKPALDRFAEKNEEDQDVFKTTLSRFVRIYAFITQVCRMFDKELHAFSVYARFLSRMMPKGIHKVDFNDVLTMEYYRLEKDFEGSITLEGKEGGSTVIKGESGSKKEKKDTLTEILDRINERFGTEFTEMDKVFMQIENDFLSEERLVNFARDNDESMFKLIFEQEFMSKAMKRYEQNEKTNVLTVEVWQVD